MKNCLLAGNELAFLFTRGKRQIQCGRLYLSVNLVKTAVLISQKAFPFSMPVQWQSPSEVKNLSPLLRDWLLNTGSLTERLQALTTTFEVDLLGQEPVALDKSEYRLLASSRDQNWQVREVILKGAPLAANGKNNSNKALHDWVFARSVLPTQLCLSKWANLGNQPLGARIFNDDNFIRSEFEIGKLDHHPISQAPFGPEQTCWARRSKFTIEQYELLVAEAFLPDSPCYW